MTDAPVIAITGANGYVGSVLSQSLSRFARVVRLVRTPQQEGDIAWSFSMEGNEAAKLLRDNGITHLVHAAWDMNARTYQDMSVSCVGGSKRLFAAAKAAGIISPIFISTISAFDGVKSAYGRSKLAVEAVVQDFGGTVLRLGLVHGDGGGGMFGKLSATIAKSYFVPMIGDGSTPQYLLSETSLCEVVSRAILGEFCNATGPITVADPQPVAFADLLHRIAIREDKKIVLIPLPWRVLYCVLKAAELIGLESSFRSDSVLSFVFQNPAPNFLRGWRA